MKGLFTWIGFDQVAVTYERDPRQAGTSKWSWLKLINLAIEGITSFTAAPLRFASVLGLIIAGVAFVYALYIIYKTVRYGEPVAGYPSLMTAVLFLGGVQLTAIGILGEYLGRVFNETKRRPLYHVKDYRPATTASAPAAGRACRCGVSACSAAHASARFWHSACSMAGSPWSGWAPRSSTCWPTPARSSCGGWLLSSPMPSASRSASMSHTSAIAAGPSVACQPARGASLARFWVVALIGFALNSMFVHLVTGVFGLAYGWAIPLIAGVTPVVTFILSKLWAFRA